MRVALVHNEDAGEGRYTSDELVRLLREAGHEVELFSRRKEEVAQAVATRPDVVVAAGGDGTVARVARALRDDDVPLYILPVGTANNLARAVGGDGLVPVLVSQLATARSAKLDVGKISGDGSSARFVEAAGVGFIGAMLGQGFSPVRRFVNALRQLSDPAPDWWSRVARDVSRLIRRQAVRHLHVEADGVDLSGEYAAAKVMNIGAIGPRIPIAGDADPGDGLFDLVLMRAEDRDALADFVAGVPGAVEYPVESRRVRCVKLDWPETDTHVDDDVWPAENEPRPRRVSIRPHGVVHLMVPNL